MTEMTDKRVLITGGNSGIGRATAVSLAKMGAEIILIARNKTSGEETIEELTSINATQSHRLFLADLSSLAEVKQVSEEILASYSTIDVLINNAGIITQNRQLSADGFEYQFAVNHLSHFLITQKLVPLLRNAEAARIINVSSAAHMMGKIHFNDIHLENGFSSFKAYAQSKLANVLFTYGLCSRLFKEGITSNAVHPGMVGSRFGAGRNGNNTHWGIKIYQKIAKSPKRGANTLVYLASSPEVDKKSGGYYINKKAKSTAKSSYDPDQASALWSMSLKMVGLEKSNI